MISDILASSAVIVLVLPNAARIPVALTELINACQPLVHAAQTLATARRRTGDRPQD
ncbi:hypothetical protein [Nocardia coubleae]|uniref:Uncharacterized protein n=1 Tax=Nocardia coubleae TaxID=356147 RepID=A0A846W5J6_9NOCA|nr:hypothetical protein [Nocardia coubleae]NKX88020.1 hypothetical protein [Nocardia coubleae]